jgi:hypothetical protein
MASVMRLGLNIGEPFVAVVERISPMRRAVCVERRESAWHP